ncbi:MAG TPA: hypothetical protein VJ992_10815 [Gemmatimonadales bacterium]|nr:hypothetical protein [Gemmatimonadales bacterium]
MAGKLSAGAQIKLDALIGARRKWDRVRMLVEQYATARNGQEQYASMITRAARDVGRVFMNNGWGVMADGANQIGMLARRGGATTTKFRGLREYVGSVYAAIDREEKKIVTEDRPDAGDSG